MNNFRRRTLNKSQGNSINGYEYVDLGLPSGLLWATCNVGATTENDYGLYFQWGDTQGWKASQVGNGENMKYFSNGDYKYYGGEKEGNSVYEKYHTNSFSYDNLYSDLQPSDDAATVNMGSGWRTPATYEKIELGQNTTNTRTTVDNVNGILFTSKINGETLFIPDAGFASMGAIRTYDRFYAWCSGVAQYDGTAAVMSSASGLARYNGLPVRGVHDPI